MENEEKIVEPEVVNEEEKKNLFDDYVMKMPESEKVEEEIEPNRPAFYSMRVASIIIDICLLFLATFGFKTLFDYTPISNGYKENYTELCYVADHMKLSKDLVPGEVYAVQIYEDDDRFNDSRYSKYTVYTPEEVGALKYRIVDIDQIDGGTTISSELRAAYNTALANNSKYKAASFNCRLIDYGLVMFAAGLSSTIFLLVIPLTNKRRATLGKLFGGIHVVHSKYYVTAKWYQIVWRWIFIFTFEIALPQLFLSNAIYTALFVPLILLLTTFTNKRRRSLNDLISRTESIDKRSYKPLDIL